MDYDDLRSYLESLGVDISPWNDDYDWATNIAGNPGKHESMVPIGDFVERETVEVICHNLGVKSPWA